MKNGNSSTARTLPESRQQFYRGLFLFSAVVLLCGIGIFLFDRQKNEPTENVSGVAETVKPDLAIIPESAMVSSPKAEQILTDKSNSFAPVVVPPEPPGVPPFTAVPETKSADLSLPPAEKPLPVNSPWERPAANSYSPWDIAAKPSESSTLNPQNQMPLAPTVAMAPMTPLTPAPEVMPPNVSPFEQQTVFPPAPVRPPAEAYAQQYHSPVAGMMPTHERLENTVHSIPQNIQPQNYPFPPSMNGNVQHGTYGQYSQYAAPQQPYPPPNPQPNTPIPAGPSTLPQQGGYYYPANTQPPLYRRIY